MTLQKWKVFYSNKKHHLKLYTDTTWHSNITMPLEGVSKFPSSLDLALETNFQNKVERLVYVEKYKLTYCIILDNITCQDLLN